MQIAGELRARQRLQALRERTSSASVRQAVTAVLRCWAGVNAANVGELASTVRSLQAAGAATDRDVKMIAGILGELAAEEPLP